MATIVELQERQAFLDAGHVDRPMRDWQSRGPRDNLVPMYAICSWSDVVTEYDLRNLFLYCRLLDAETEGAEDDEIARIFFASIRGVTLIGPGALCARIWRAPTG